MEQRNFKGLNSWPECLENSMAPLGDILLTQFWSLLSLERRLTGNQYRTVLKDYLYFVLLSALKRLYSMALQSADFYQAEHLWKILVWKVWWPSLPPKHKIKRIFFYKRVKLLPLWIIARQNEAFTLLTLVFCKKQFKAILNKNSAKQI